MPLKQVAVIFLPRRFLRLDRYESSLLPGLMENNSKKYQGGGTSN